MLRFSFPEVVLSRRSFLSSAATVLAAPMINRGRFQLFAQSQSEYSALTLELVHRSTVIDMLGLLTLDYRKLVEWEAHPDGFAPADYTKLKSSGINIFHPAVGYTSGDVYAASLADITGWNEFIARHAGDFLRVDGPADFERVKATGKIGIVIGQQNSSHFRSVDDVDRFYKMGQRVSQLTYGPNRIGGGSTLWSGDRRAHESRRHGRGCIALCGSNHHRCDRGLAKTRAGHAFQLPRAGADECPLQD